MTCPTRSKPSKKNPSQEHKDKKTSESNSKNKNATKSLVTFFICKDINEYQNYLKRKQIFTKKNYLKSFLTAKISFHKHIICQQSLCEVKFHCVSNIIHETNIFSVRKYHCKIKEKSFNFSFILLGAEGGTCSASKQCTLQCLYHTES